MRLHTDGSQTLLGDYLGVAVRTAIPVEFGTKCILLLAQDANTASTFHNVLCITQDGDLVWKADLPQTPDAFVEIGMEAGAFYATSWSGFRVSLDLTNGRILSREFVK